VKVKILVALMVSFTEAAHAETFYGGVVVKNGRQYGPAIGLTLKDDGSIAGRILLTYRCGRKSLIYNVAVKVAGRANGASFTAKGRRQLGKGAGLLRYTLTGTLTADGATGRLRLRNQCGSPNLNFVLKAAAAPAGTPAVPPRSTLFHGLTSQTVAGVRLPISLRVAGNGRVYLNEYVQGDCGRFSWPLSNAMVPTTVKADGTFGRTEHWHLRYGDGSLERYTVQTAGRFLTDGAAGTVRIRMTYRKGRARARCDTGVVNWAARL
jgi:hypothetical protein